jgi:hypothetical protein
VAIYDENGSMWSKRMSTLAVSKRREFTFFGRAGHLSLFS